MSQQAFPPAAQADGQPHDHGDAHGPGHVVGWPVLLATCVALLVLTWFTVSVAYADLRALSFPIAMLIATVKAALVCLYFMHLRYDKPFHAVVLIGSLLFVSLFVSFALMDTISYDRELIWIETLDPNTAR